MAEDSKISWLWPVLPTDWPHPSSLPGYSFSGHWGCSQVSPACANCYSLGITHHFKKAIFGPEGTRVMMSEATWSNLTKWNRQALKRGYMAPVFAYHMSDWAEGPETCPETFYPVVEASRRRYLATIPETPGLLHMTLTKRTGKIAQYIPSAWLTTPPPNLWYGGTAESQHYLDQRSADLANLPAAGYLLSIEPMLEALTLPPWLEGPRWHIVVGGESGTKARPMDPAWATALRRQCWERGIPFHFKQGSQANWPAFHDFASFPPELQVREWPVATRIADRSAAS